MCWPSEAGSRVAIVGVLGAPAALILWGGMLLVCLKDKNSSFAAKLAWILLFLITGWFGSAAYFFAVYGKQTEEQVASA